MKSKDRLSVRLHWIGSETTGTVWMKISTHIVQVSAKFMVDYYPGIQEYISITYISQET